MKKREDRRQEEKGDGKERRRGGWTRVVIPSSPLASLLTLYNPAQVAHSPADPKEKGGERGFKGGQDASPALSAVTASWLHPFHPPQGGRCGHRKGGQPRNSCHPASDKRSQPVPRIISLLPLSPRVNSSLWRHFNLISAQNLLLGRLWNLGVVLVGVGFGGGRACFDNHPSRQSVNTICLAIWDGERSGVERTSHHPLITPSPDYPNPSNPQDASTFLLQSWTYAM